MKTFEELMEDNDFIERFAKAGTDEARQALFAENNIEMSLEDIRDLCRFSESIASGDIDSDELPENALEMIAGGRCGFLHGYYDGRMNTGKKGWGIFYSMGKALGKWNRKETQRALSSW